MPCALTRALAAVAASVSLISAQAVFSPARTAWGDPDLQGMWPSGPSNIVPFERAEALGTRDTLTEEEFLALNAAVQEQVQIANAETVVPGSRTGVNPPAHWLEPGRASRQASLIVDPPNGRLPPMTPDGAQRARAWPHVEKSYFAGPADFTPYDRCITRGVLGSAFPNIYGTGMEILQAPGLVIIRHEMIHETRIVPLDGRPPLASTIRHYMGEPRGRWEGDTLVVETASFRSEPAYRGSNPDTLRLIERFTLTSKDTIEWSVTVDDRTSWPRPWTFAMPLTRNDEEAVFEYACHEGNRAMANILSAARAEEKTATIAATLPGSGTGARTPGEPPSPAGREALAPIVRSGLSGNWVAAAAGGRGGGRGNFAGFSTPTRVVITESPGDVTVSSNTGTQNQMQTALFRLDGSEQPVPGPIGWDTRATAAREDSTLIVTIARTIEGPDGPLNFQIREIYSVSGDVLTLERSQGTRSQRTTYRRE